MESVPREQGRYQDSVSNWFKVNTNHKVSCSQMPTSSINTSLTSYNFGIIHLARRYCVSDCKKRYTE